MGSVPPPAVLFKNVDFEFEGQVYFRDLTFHIHTGETFAFYSIGNSGKSFLLRMILGLVPPVRGSVTVYGQELTSYSPDELFELRRKMKFISRDSDMLNNLTVYNNIALSLDFHSTLPDSEIRSKVLRIMRVLDLTRFADEYPVHLHEDVKKKIAFARAIISEPEMLLVDEFAYGYDEIHARKSLALFSELIGRQYPHGGLTTVITTAHIKDYLPFVNRIGVLFNKELVFVGNNRELLETDHPVVRRLLDNDITILADIKE